MVPILMQIGIVWEELSGVFNWWEVPWCISRDFNVTNFLKERVGATQVTSTMWVLRFYFRAGVDELSIGWRVLNLV